MDSMRNMSEREKYRRASGMSQLYQKHVLAFVEERLGPIALHELSSAWQAAVIPNLEAIPESKKYDCAYSNWLHMARCSHDFLAELLDHDEVIDYKRLLLQLYLRQQDNSDLALYRMFGNSNALVKAWAYEMQWLTPIAGITKAKDQYTCVVNNCKILQTASTERVCRVDCIHVGTNLARKIYCLERRTMQVDHGCTITLTPLEDTAD